VNIQNKKQATPLLMSISIRNTEFVRILLDAGAEVNHVSVIYSLKQKKSHESSGRNCQLTW